MKEAFDTLLPYIGTALLTLLGLALTKLTEFLASKAKSERTKRVLTLTDDLAMTAIRSVFQAYVKPLKEGGAWTEEKHGLAKQQAMLELKSYLGPKGLAELHKLLGAADLDGFLGGLIDEMVHNNKLTAQVAKAGASAAPLAD